ncbi:hypothetical protein A3D70_01745 [Candidatus Adlerbacteria bacterium RIFCSPHIGHO2_02_FULL_54_18]|uniref:Uncharacterized protein n=2 Tax=Candidatus Adleribacteriota TaxID=1752736 RepID=A0A1F4Y4D7_9BACT|nr:MAG: hypothetical protein A2949_00720 [Candidatus Adlerbacteria bacterium RIFCSPLOWO2_01_FULL_54_21b]OGC88809.1 MAG: hypothetical protein A3D70_01745 [Candidatus Adlerbacteria bacterium RIFCSPHIGHO2_02_FULL_54_18]
MVFIINFSIYMKNAYFFSAIVFSAAFVIGTIISYTWPISPDVWQSISNPTADMLGYVVWILSVIGFVAFIIGWWNERVK